MSDQNWFTNFLLDGLQDDWVQARKLRQHSEQLADVDNQIGNAYEELGTLRVQQSKIREELVNLRIAVKVLADVLISNGIDPAELTQRVSAERERLFPKASVQQPPARQAQPKPPTSVLIRCGRCGTEMKQSESYLTGDGVVCSDCFQRVEKE